MAETPSSSGRKRAKVDGPLASSSASSRKFDGAAQFKSKFQPSWTIKWPLIIAENRISGTEIFNIFPTPLGVWVYLGVKTCDIFSLFS